MFNLFKQEDFSPDLYTRLGIEQNADERTIRKAYRDIAQETHPDKPGNEGKINQFVAASRAYEVLKDPHQRAMYNSELNRRTSKETLSYSGMPDLNDPDLYSDITYTDEELQRYKEAAARFAAGTPRSGDLSSIFNHHAKSPFGNMTPSTKVRRNPIKLLDLDEDETGNGYDDFPELDL